MSEQGQQNRNLIAIKDLPIYTEPRKVTDFRFVEDEPPIGQGLFRAARLTCNDYCSKVKARLGIVNRSLEPMRDVATVTQDYFQRERELFPKAAAITLGGMVGFVIGMRKRSTFSKFFYSLAGLLTMSAFCYPQETMVVIQTGVAHAKRTWEDFQKSPEPKK